MSGSWQMNFILQSYYNHIFELYCTVFLLFPLIKFLYLLLFFYPLQRQVVILCSDKYHFIR